MVRTKRELEVERREQAVRRLLAGDLRTQREDAGISQARLARAAGMSPGYLSRIEAEEVEPTVHAYVALCHALGGDLRMRFEPGAGVPLRDRYQSRMVEALFRLAHPRWKRFSEVGVYRPVRGVIDAVLHDPDAGEVIATEAQSLIRRLEQQQRWANVKADALLAGSELRLALSGESVPTVSRLLLLRATPTNRRIVEEFGATIAAAYPGDPAAAYASLTGTGRWPGSALLWVRVRGADAELLRPRPRRP